MCYLPLRSVATLEGDQGTIIVVRVRRIGYFFRDGGEAAKNPYLVGTSFVFEDGLLHPIFL